MTDQAVCAVLELLHGRSERRISRVPLPVGERTRKGIGSTTGESSKPAAGAIYPSSRRSGSRVVGDVRHRRRARLSSPVPALQSELRGPGPQFVDRRPDVSAVQLATHPKGVGPGFDEVAARAGTATGYRALQYESPHCRRAGRVRIGPKFTAETSPWWRSTASIRRVVSASSHFASSP